MKKLLLFIALFFSIVPYIHQGSIQLNVAEKLFAQSQNPGGEVLPEDTVCGGGIISREIMEENDIFTVEYICSTTINCATKEVLSTSCDIIDVPKDFPLPGDDPGGTGTGTGGGGGGGGVGTDASRAAARILASSKVTLATAHQRGVADQANAKQNMRDVSYGYNAHTSNYGNAPGTITPLNQKLLNGIEILAKNYTFAISEIAGGSHTVGSAHYYGNAIDVNIVNGVHVNNMTDADIIAFRNAAYTAGASKVYDPLNDPAHHYSHFHIQW